MRKLIVLLGLVLIPLTGFAAERMVLGELFTSTTCGPCVSGNSILDGILAQKDDYLAVIRIHMNWPSPGNDPWYSYIAATNNSRRYLYNISSIPALVVDGISKPPRANWGTTIDSRHETTTPVAMNLYRTFIPAEAYLEGEVQGEGEVTIVLTNEEFLSLSFYLFGALVANDQEYTGTNGDPEHDQVLIAMLPKPSDDIGLNGTEVTLKGNSTMTLTVTYDTYDVINLPPTYEGTPVDAEDCELVFWCQKPQSDGLEVLQAAKVDITSHVDFELSNPVVIPPDEKLDAGEQAGVNITISNNSDEPLSDVTVFLEIADEDITVLQGKATAETVEAGATFTVEDQLLIEAGEDYDGSSFEMSFWAGAGNGSLAPEFAQTYEPGIEENGSSYPFSVDVPTIVTDRGFINLSSPGFLDAEVTLYDAAGCKVSHVYSGKLSSGVNRLPLEARDLTEGVYFIKVLCGGYNKVSKLLVLH